MKRAAEHITNTSLLDGVVIVGAASVELVVSKFRCVKQMYEQLAACDVKVRLTSNAASESIREENCHEVLLV